MHASRRADMTALHGQLAAWGGRAWRPRARRGQRMIVNMRDKRWGVMLDEIYDFGCARFVIAGGPGRVRWECALMRGVDNMADAA